MNRMNETCYSCLYEWKSKGELDTKEEKKVFGEKYVSTVYTLSSPSHSLVTPKSNLFNLSALG